MSATWGWILIIGAINWNDDAKVCASICFLA
jgi:hypothetical protein